MAIGESAQFLALDFDFPIDVRDDFFDRVVEEGECLVAFLGGQFGRLLAQEGTGLVLRGHKSAVRAVAISPDNRWLVTGSYDKTARLSLLQVNDLINLARITVRRNFSADEWKLCFPGKNYRKTFDELPGPDESVTQKDN